MRGLVVNLGGDLRVRGDIDQTIGIADPLADSESSDPLMHIAVKDKSVSTSGSSHRGFLIQGQWYSHVFDPRSGRPVDRVKSATVVADRGVDADALAKVCGVLEPDESLRLVQSLVGVECLIIMADGAGRQKCRLERTRTSRSARRQCSPSRHGRDDDKPATGSTGPSPPMHQARRPWDPEFELVVNFEINHPEARQGGTGGRTWPIWVEDSDGNAGAHAGALGLAMGGSGPFQWLPDLKRWYQERGGTQGSREEGHLFHHLAADAAARQVQGDLGRQGQPRQAARRRRIHDLYRSRPRARNVSKHSQASVRFPTSRSREDLKGNVEIRSASIEYRRKAAAK